MLAAFLNGWIVEKRGRQDEQKIVNEKKLTNNIILRKIKIALKLKDHDIIEFYDLADVRLSKHELSAFFRHPDKAQYRPCQDQFFAQFFYKACKRNLPKADQTIRINSQLMNNN